MVCKGLCDVGQVVMVCKGLCGVGQVVMVCKGLCGAGQVVMVCKGLCGAGQGKLGKMGGFAKGVVDACSCHHFLRIP